MDTYYVKLGKEIREIRESRKMTLQEVSSKLSITLKTLANYETGRTKVPFPTLIKLCDIYKHDLGALIDGSVAWLNEIK